MGKLDAGLADEIGRAVEDRRDGAVGLLQELVRVPHALVTGGEPAVEGAPYGADMRLFIRFGGMPCVMYGAGDVNVEHAPDEHVSITELLTATKTIACLLVDWCGGVGGRPPS